MELVYGFLIFVFVTVFCAPFLIKCHPDSWLRGAQKLFLFTEKRSNRKKMNAQTIHVETPKDRKRKRPDLKSEATWQSKSKSAFAQKLREDRLASDPKRRRKGGAHSAGRIKGR